MSTLASKIFGADFRQRGTSTALSDVDPHFGDVNVRPAKMSRYVCRNRQFLANEFEGVGANGPDPQTLIMDPKKKAPEVEDKSERAR